MGHHNRHYGGDQFANAGKWGPPTSTANFCEEDYIVTLYIAEFINTVSNLAYIYFAVRYPGIPSCIKTATKPNGKSSNGSNGSDKAATAAKAPAATPSWTRPDFLSASLWVLGFLSLGFHMTLKHATQYGDELAMLVLGGALMRGVAPRSAAATAGAAAATVAASAIYLKTGNILHHVFAFNAMLLVIGARTLFLVFFRRPVEDRRRYINQFLRACGSLALGYFLWQVDLEKCSDLRSMRHYIGVPWAWLLEMHGWWHFLTALGASLYIRLIRDLDP